MANKPKYTDQDIREALEHGERNPRSDHARGIASIMDGNNLTQRIADKAISEAFDGRDAAVMGTGQIREADKSNLWLAKLSTETAAESLRLAFMSKNPGMQPREVGSAADTKIAEFYTEAAKNTANEIERLEYVQFKAKSLANDMKGGK